MVKQVVRDVLFLKQKSEPATKADAQVITDLMDTLKANEEHCVGMAANMIGVKELPEDLKKDIMLLPNEKINEISEAIFDIENLEDKIER